MYFIARDEKASPQTPNSLHRKIRTLFSHSELVKAIKTSSDCMRENLIMTDLIKIVFFCVKIYSIVINPFVVEGSMLTFKIPRGSELKWFTTLNFQEK